MGSVHCWLAGLNTLPWGHPAEKVLLCHICYQRTNTRLVGKLTSNNLRLFIPESLLSILRLKESLYYLTTCKNHMYRCPLSIVIFGYAHRWNLLLDMQIKEPTLGYAHKWNPLLDMHINGTHSHLIWDGNLCRWRK